MQTALTKPHAGDRQHVPTDQAAPERATITIFAKPSRHEITQWANSALRNSEIEYIDEALIEDFADGLPALRADLAAPSAPARERCGSCGAFGRKCYGNGPEGPDCDEWIGETDGRACCYACYGSAPAPAEVEGLVKRLRVKGRMDREQINHHIRRMEVERIEAATALTELQAQNERLRGERQLLAEAICGGEDIPGLLESTPVEALVGIARKTHRDHSEEIDARIKAEAERDELISVISDEISRSRRHLSAATLAAYAKLKGDV